MNKYLGNKNHIYLQDVPKSTMSRKEHLVVSIAYAESSLVTAR